MNVAAYREKEKNEKTGKKEVGEKRNSGPISKRLRAALLLLFRRQHYEKMVCIRKEPEVAVTLWKANSHFGPIQTGLGTAPPR